ncbi:MAG: S8 family serine peptidase, partial [Alphaproteobacteria bacterium]|nr:S8 family serine peptidase [Alphaproteobacteria bacterium]
GTSTVSGTSFAAPQVTRLAAKFLLNQRNLSTEELKNMIFRSARPTPQLEDKVKFGVIDTF